MTDRNAIHLSTGVDFPRAGMDSIMLWGGGDLLYLNSLSSFFRTSPTDERKL